MRGFSATHIDQSKVVFIDWELLRADVFLQGRGIGALWEQNTRHAVTIITIVSRSRSFICVYAESD